MRINIIKKMAEDSYRGNSLDQNKVKTFSKLLKRDDLKVYIKKLKMIESRKIVKITVPHENGLREIKKYFSVMYAHKKIVVNTDPSMLSGIKVEDLDNTYELSLKGFLESALAHSSRND